MLQIRKACCCYSLRHGSVVIGIGFLLASGVSIITSYCLKGLAKIFGEKSAKPHGGNWLKHHCTPILRALGVIFTTPPAHQGSEGPDVMTNSMLQYLDLRNPGGVVKIAPRALKIGEQSRLYPISTVGFRTFFSKNFGQAYCLTPLLVRRITDT